MSEQQFDIDSPADLDLLGGTFDSEADDSPVDELADAEAEPPKEDEKEVDQEDVEAKEADQEESAPAKRDPVIPRARFDDVNAKLHAQREENERLRAELETRSAQPVQATDLDALESDYFDALLDGDKDKAKSIRATINAEIYRKAEETSTATVSRAISEREASASFSSAVSKTVQDYPFLDSTSPDANAEAIGEVIEWRDFYISKGENPANALQKAAAKVAPAYTTAAAPAPVADQRKQQARVAGAKVSAAQPPRVDAGVGNRAIPTGDDIVSSQDKWEKASDEERLRYLS